MLSLADAVLVSSEYLHDVYSSVHSNVVYIPDVVEDKFFGVKKEHSDNSNLRVMYCGVAQKAKELLSIKDALLSVNKKVRFKMLYICENDPGLGFMAYDYVKYDHETIHNDLLKGDVKIIPYDLSNSYNLGHSALKAAVPAAVGIPVVASPLGSYKGIVQLFCNSEQDWHDNLLRLLRNIEDRCVFGECGRQVVKTRYVMSAVKNRYLNLYRSLLR